MTVKIEQAARVTDPVEHSRSTFGKMAGFAAGALIGVAIVLTSPVSVPALAVVGTIAGGAAFGSGLGGLAMSYLGGKRIAGDVETGARTVFVGGTADGVCHKAARVEDIVGCHDDVIATGLLNIFIEDKNATRATEETRCAGKLKKDACCPTVFYGGPSARFVAVRYHGEDPEWFFWLDLATGVVSGRAAAQVPRYLHVIERFPRAYRAFRAVKQAMSIRSRLRGGPVRDRAKYVVAAFGAVGDDRSAAAINRALDTYTPSGWVFPPADPIPYADEPG